MLSTCNGTSQVHFDDGRTVVIARKVRPGESTSVDTSRINLNDDVIMPYAWYVNQGKEPHPYYTGGFQIPYPDVEPSAPGITDPVNPGPADPVTPPTSDNTGTTPPDYAAGHRHHAADRSGPHRSCGTADRSDNLG